MFTLGSQWYNLHGEPDGQLWYLHCYNVTGVFTVGSNVTGADMPQFRGVNPYF